MKSFNFKVSVMMIVACITLMMTGCKGEEGPPGPEGAAGPQGPQGIQGPAGNANVTLYKYGTMTFTGSHQLIIPNVSRATMDNSILLAYYNPSNEAETTWYLMPGFGSQGIYNIRTYWYQNGTNYLYGIRSMTPTGASYTLSLTFKGVRIFLIPASTTINAVAIAEELPFDVKSYQEVVSYYGINK